MTEREELPNLIEKDFSRAREELERLVRIPSVSADGFDPAHVRASADATAEILEEAGATGVRLLEVDGAHPAVLAEAPGAEGTPTVLLYAHHDVQPPGAEDVWDSPPFEPVERDGRMYGRGTSDDKAGIVMHAAAVRAFRGRPPVNVKVLIEGEEETGSGHLGEFLERYGEMLAADVLVLADSDNWKLGIPGLTASIRGVADCDVEVRTLDHAVHSGVFGGPVPDALTVLARVLATLHDDRGNVAVPGLATGPPPDLDLAEDDLRTDSGLRPGVQLLGEGSITERLWMKPAVSILGIDAPSTQQSSNQLVPMARARVSLRVPPGQDARKAQAALVAHLEKAAPWGATIKVEPGKGVGEPFAIRTEGPVFDAVRRALAEAWGADVVEMGMGGSIPLVAEFARAFPEAAILLTGAADPDTRAHGENESVHLGELERACLGEALFLSHLAAGPA